MFLGNEYHVFGMSPTNRKIALVKIIQIYKKSIRVLEIFGPIGPDDTRVSVTQFASEIHPEVTFNQGQDFTTVNRMVNQVKFRSTGTMTGLALEKLRTQIFTPEAGARRNIRNGSIF